MAYNPEHRFKPGRLFITCINAQSIRSRADSSNDGTLTPHLLFKLQHSIQQSRIGTIHGYDVAFDNEVIYFDIDNPEQLLVDGDISLIVQLRDGLKGLIAQCKASITDVLLTPGVDAARSLSVKNPSDTSTNSTVNLQFNFVEANPGLLKLNLSTFRNCVKDSGKCYISVSTSDGQSNTSSLADRSSLEGGFSYWVDNQNWFEEIDIEIHDENREQVVGEGKLVIIDCLKGSDAEMCRSLIAMSWDRRLNIQSPSISVQHCFLTAGIVIVKCIDAIGVGDVANPRVVVKSDTRTYITEKKPTLTTSSSLLWDNELDIPVVRESSLTIEFGDFDQVTGELELLGSSILNLLPLYMRSSIDVSVDLKHQNELGQITDGGKISMALQFVFQGPANVAFPRDQGTVQSYIPGEDTATELTKNDTDSFSEFDIRNAFNKLDLDKNGYIGAAELRHCLTCMGEHVTEAEIDMMISMLDLNGDGMVSYRGFKAMVESPDPATDDFSYLYVPSRADADRDQDSNNMHEMFRNHVQAHNITKEDVLRAWDSLRRSASFHMGRNQVSKLLPQLELEDSSEVFDFLKSETDSSAVDGRQLIMSFVSVLAFTAEEKCKLAFDMFDVDGSGYLSIDQIEVLLTCTHFSKRETLKKKAYNLLRLVGDRTGGVSMKALILGADKFPSLIFPTL